MRKAMAAAALILALSACMPGSGEYGERNSAGFFSGVWHGWLAPLTLIVQVFDEDVRIYEPNNTGWWYDAGFYVAVISGFGSVRLVRRKRGG